MNQSKLKSHLLQILVLVFILLVFTECKNSAQVKKDVSTAIATIMFMVFMVLGGIPSIIFSAISYKSPNSAMKVLAIVFVSILGLFSLFSIPMYSELWKAGAHEWIMLLTIIQFGCLIVSIVLIALRANNQKINNASPSEELPKPTPKKNDNEIDYMEEILKN